MSYTCYPRSQIQGISDLLGYPPSRIPKAQFVTALTTQCCRRDLLSFVLNSVKTSMAGTLNFCIPSARHRTSNVPQAHWRFMKPGKTQCGAIAKGQSIMFACLFVLIADVKTRKWNFLLEDHNKLSEMPSLLVLDHAIGKL